MFMDMHLGSILLCHRCFCLTINLKTRGKDCINFSSLINSNSKKPFRFTLFSPFFSLLRSSWFSSSSSSSISSFSGCRDPSCLLQVTPSHLWHQCFHLKWNYFIMPQLDNAEKQRYKWFCWILFQLHNLAELKKKKMMQEAKSSRRNRHFCFRWREQAINYFMWNQIFTLWYV